MTFTLNEYQVRFGACDLGTARELPELHTQMAEFRSEGKNNALDSFRELVVVIEMDVIDPGVRALLEHSGMLPEDFLLKNCDLELRDLADREKYVVLPEAKMVGYERDFSRVLFSFPGRLID